MWPERNAQVTVGLADIVAKCLAARPEDRYGSAAEMSARLTAFVRRMKPNYTSANVVEVMASLYPDVVAEPQSGFTKLGSMSAAARDQRCSPAVASSRSPSTRA